MSATRTSTQILTAEQAFFDQESMGLEDRALVIPRDQLDRYQNARPRPTNIAKDTMFARLNPLDGKRVLEYGCGTGGDSCHLANCGAQVTAFDLSPVSIEKARRRAELLGLADRIRFEVGSASDLQFESSSFDNVVGIAILHHLHMELDAVYADIARVLKPDGVAYFIEPVANSALLRALRPIIPVPRHATPDERQLTYADFERMRAHGFRSIEYVHFHGASRLGRIVGSFGARMLRRVDHHAQRLLPFLKAYYGIALVVARR